MRENFTQATTYWELAENWRDLSLGFSLISILQSVGIGIAKK